MRVKVLARGSVVGVTVILAVLFAGLVIPLAGQANSSKKFHFPRLH